MDEIFLICLKGILPAQVSWTTVEEVAAAKAMERPVRTEYNDEFYRLIARIGIQEEEKLFFLKYIGSLSLYIEQEMEFLTVGTLVDAFHYARKIEAKQKGKACFTNKPIGKTSDNKSPTDSDKSRHPS